MEQDPDITYSRFNKRFSNFLWTLLTIFRFRGRLSILYYFILFYFFLSNCTCLWVCFGVHILTQFPVQGPQNSPIEHWPTSKWPVWRFHCRPCIVAEMTKRKVEHSKLVWLLVVTENSFEKNVRKGQLNYCNIFPLLGRYWWLSE